jgi:hypothetical protein
MPSDSTAPLPRSKRLTPSRIMTSIAFLALAFAFLPTILSSAFAVSVLGILVLDGMHPPQVTSGCGARRWFPWVIWFLALTACPVAISVVGTVYTNHGPIAYDRVATRVVNGLGLAQLGVSVIASIAVVALTRRSFRWLAWAPILAIGAFTVVLLVGASMATTGAYL